MTVLSPKQPSVPQHQSCRRFCHRRFCHRRPIGGHTIPGLHQHYTELLQPAEVKIRSQCMSHMQFVHSELTFAEALSKGSIWSRVHGATMAVYPSQRARYALKERWSLSHLPLFSHATSLITPSLKKTSTPLIMPWSLSFHSWL